MASTESTPSGSLELRWLLERLPVAGYTCDSEGLITFYNNNAVITWGRAPLLNDARDRFCGSFKLYSTDGTEIPHEECWMGLALRNRKQYDGEEIIIERPDGSRATVLAHANPLFDDEGRLTGAVNLLVDITERKRLEETLQLADRRKDEFLAVLSHEMRNPLATVMNSLQVISTDQHSIISRRATEIMDRQLQQLARLVDDLIDVSRVSLGRIELRKETVMLSSSLEAALEASRALIDGRGHTLVVDLPDDPIYLSADSFRLRQIFTNIITNAAKFTQRKGLIGITARLEEETVKVSISDNGVGISPESQDRIFDNFAQVEVPQERSQGGLGIGLSLARQLAALHGGTVEVKSEGIGKGSMFTVTLPIDTVVGRSDYTSQLPKAEALRSAI